MKQILKTFVYTSTLITVVVIGIWDKLIREKFHETLANYTGGRGGNVRGGVGSGGTGGMHDVPITGSSGDNNPPLKNAEQAQIDPAKFEKYSMDQNNPNNQGKWKAFEDVGYNVHTLEGRSKSAQNIMAQVEDQLPQSPATFDRDTPSGPRYQVNIQITGPNGRRGTLLTVWQYDMNSDVPRLITNWLQVYK